jgi:hypothetical protein
MKKVILAALVAILPLAAAAQDDYDDGSYWTVTSVDTHPGMFDDYMSDLNNVWRKSMEMLMNDGKVVSYKVFGNVNARHEEPDLWLMVEWSSGAAYMDTPREYWDANAKKLFGSMDKGTEANIKRGELRTIMGETLLREMSFK